MLIEIDGIHQAVPVNVVVGIGRTRVAAVSEAVTVEVFVRDRGRGFDLEAVPADRYGVRRSILDRLRRHGGTAEVRTALGAGTEVRLRLPRPARPPQEDQ